MSLKNDASNSLKHTSQTCTVHPVSLSVNHYSNPHYSLSSVDAADSDITFVSSDNTLFHIHRKNLEAHAVGFPPAEIDTCGEMVRLTEDSVTLELLFAFMYPRRHPDLECTPFELLAPLAEAAEKYEVFSAMNICKIRMRLGVFQLHDPQFSRRFSQKLPAGSCARNNGIWCQAWLP